MTLPDWVPFMRRAAAIVTDGGGMTSQAAIVCRELGLPCVVGTREATTRLRDGDPVTVDGAAGEVLYGMW
jgi:pyruvate,water dikinase